MRSQSFNLPAFYRNLSLFYFIASFLLLVSVLYLIWARVVIIIHPKAETVDQEISFQVKEGASLAALGRDNIIAGYVQPIVVEDQTNFESTGSKNVTADTVGEIVIINNYSKDQTLVEKTRLSAPNDPSRVLVRLKNAVVVPAQGRVKVQVYPDDLVNFKAIEPMRFIIPGLWQPLQDKIYAENEKTLSVGGQVKYVTQEDLDKAIDEVKQNSYEKIATRANEQLQPPQTLWPRLVVEDKNEITFNAKAGDEIAEFIATMKFSGYLIIFDESQVVSLVRNKIKETDVNRRVVELNPQDFKYSIDSFNLENKSAKVNLKVQAKTIISDKNDLLAKDNLLGKTEQEITSYFSQFNQVESVEVKFYPSWLKKTPRINGKIQVQIVE